MIRELEEFTSDLQSLQKLDLSYNDITRINRDTFRGLHSLNDLYLSNNRLSAISSDSFRGLKKIANIDLSHNYFEVIQIKWLRSLETQVKTISLDGTYTFYFIKIFDITSQTYVIEKCKLNKNGQSCTKFNTFHFHVLNSQYFPNAIL